MISDMLIESLKEQRRIEIIVPVGVERFEAIGNMGKLDYESDSLDEMDSERDMESIKYDYSPEYKIYADDYSPTQVRFHKKINLIKLVVGIILEFNFSQRLNFYFNFYS